MLSKKYPLHTKYKNKKNNSNTKFRPSNLPQIKLGLGDTSFVKTPSVDIRDIFFPPLPKGLSSFLVSPCLDSVAKLLNVDIYQKLHSIMLCLTIVRDFVFVTIFWYLSESFIFYVCTTFL